MDWFKICLKDFIFMKWFKSPSKRKRNTLNRHIGSSGGFCGKTLATWWTLTLWKPKTLQHLGKYVERFVLVLFVSLLSAEHHGITQRINRCPSQSVYTYQEKIKRDRVRGNTTHLFFLAKIQQKQQHNRKTYIYWFIHFQSFCCPTVTVS